MRTPPRPVASQPGGGGLNLDGWNTRRTPPPLDIVRVTSSIWKTPPLLDIHKHPPPLDIARVTSSTYSKGGTKLLKGGTKLLKGGTKLLKGGTKLLKGGTKLLKGGTKLLKGGTKLLKGGTKSLGWATGGGRTTPPTPPGYGPAPPPLPKPKPSQLSQSPLGHLGGPDTAQRHDILLSQK